ncbi:hypothetical protein pVa21_034 [Vibrio phage pVa-21]|nr:hypothetical protein pVa21_034 [Vibrio phage pVa-21]
MSMPITKETIENMYYKWWLEICKSVSPEQRNRIRCAVSIIEAYRSDFMYNLMNGIHRHDVVKEGYNAKEWEFRMKASLERAMANDKKRVAALAARCPNLLISIAGVINGVRRATDIRNAFSTILLLDVVDNTTIGMLDKVELENVRFIQQSKSIYLPLREPEVYSVIKEVEKLLATNKVLSERIDREYEKRQKLLSSVLGIQVEVEEAA